MKTKTLLLVDADPDSAEMISIAAVKTGHEVVRAHTSREAFLVLEHGLEDLIVIDLDPGVHGIDVLEKIEISPATPPVIVLTDMHDSYMAGFAAARGVAACLTKPFTTEAMASLIEQLSTRAWRVSGRSCDAWGHPTRDQHPCYSGPGYHRHILPPPTELECANL